MNGNDLITGKFRQLLMGAVLAVGTTLVGVYIESIPLMVAGVAFIWGLSRYGYKTMRCPYCDTSLYKHLFKETAIWASWILWSKSREKICPFCRTDFNRPVQPEE